MNEEHEFEAWVKIRHMKAGWWMLVVMLAFVLGLGLGTLVTLIVTR